LGRGGVLGWDFAGKLSPTIRFAYASLIATTGNPQLIPPLLSRAAGVLRTVLEPVLRDATDIPISETISETGMSDGTIKVMM